MFPFDKVFLYIMLDLEDCPSIATRFPMSTSYQIILSNAHEINFIALSRSFTKKPLHNPDNIPVGIEYKISMTEKNKFPQKI